MAAYLAEDRTELGVGLLHLLLPFVGASPAIFIARQDALPVAQARIEDQVADREHQGADEQPEPPLGQRVVVFLDAVEAVAHGLVGGVAALALAGGEQQPGQANQATDGQYADVRTPEGGHCPLLLFAAGSCPAEGRRSSTKGSRRASAKVTVAAAVEYPTRVRPIEGDHHHQCAQAADHADVHSHRIHLLFLIAVPSTCR
ncbi:hypothetical protein PPS11_35185 [Pseudomonas putida S11]|nr:hypothetical protein PPS11_35185 [Pseudomonas putida S11]